MNMATTYLCQVAQVILDNEAKEREVRLNAQVSTVLGMQEVLDDLHKLSNPTDSQKEEIESLECRIPQEQDKLGDMQQRFYSEMQQLGAEAQQFLSQ